ncbi:hypothetical protein HDU96_009751 [Phlyctochytrium bullatum]|nr:hypothetical protein HDU96_009751 [Phlyctochytrium bullatum]
MTQNKRTEDGAVKAAAAATNGHHDPDTTTAPVTKKAKMDITTTTTTTTTTAPATAFRPGILAPHTRDALRQSYVDSEPYKHVVISDLMDDALLRAVRAECRAELHATHKETDIYRVFQTGDLANLDGLPADELSRLPALKQLRDALYSDEFRRFVEHVTGVPRLSPSKKDLSHNIYKRGCHLLCHDDVIGTRSVSFILYLTDPDEPWEVEEGGALELYPVVAKGTPAVDPTVIIPPKWNQLAMFAVQPGLSFHSVSEVVAKDGRDRPSISGWFHVLQPEDMTEEEKKAATAVASTAAEDKAKASLDQLTDGDDAKPFRPLAPTPDTWTDAAGNDVFLSDAEIAQLEPFVNPRYLSPQVVSQANERFVEESSIQLVSFLRKEVADALAAGLQAQDTLDGFLRDGDDALRNLPVADYTKGVQRGWRSTGPSHKCRFLELAGPAPKPNPAATPAELADTHLAQLRDTLFDSPAFRHLLYLITSLSATHSRGWVRRFRPGMDFTLATSTSTSILDATLCLVADTPASRARAWAGDDFGGFECYMAPDEGNEDPAQYRAADVGGGGALLSVSARNNTLTLVMREPGLMKFVKYVGAGAPGSRWDASWEYRFEE